MKDLVKNNKEDVAKRKPKKAKYWTKQLMQEFFHEQSQEEKKSSIFSINNFSGIYDPSDL